MQAQPAIVCKIGAVGFTKVYDGCACMYVNQLVARYATDCMKAKTIGLFLVWADTVTFDHRLSIYVYVYEC